MLINGKVIEDEQLHAETDIVANHEVDFLGRMNNEFSRSRCWNNGLQGSDLF